MHIEDFKLLVVDSAELDHHGARELNTALKGLIDAGHHNLILDLSQLRFVSSVAVGAIAAAVKSLMQHGGELKILGLANRRVYGVFKLADLDRFIDLQTSASALDAPPAAN